jgi:hypothetical protein
MEHAAAVRVTLGAILLVLLVAGVSLLLGRRGCATYGSARPLALTMKGRSDGFGAQLQALLAIIATARRLGLPFVFTPLDIQDHDMDMRAVSRLLDHFRRTYPPLPEHAIVQVNLLNDDWTQQTDHPHIFSAADSILWHEQPEDAYTVELLHDTRAAFLEAAGSSLSLPTLSGQDIAVHIRRGDVQSRTLPGKSRYVPMAFYEKLIPALIDRHPHHTIHVFSEGKQREFQTISGAGRVRLHLNEAAHETFIQLMTAGTLVTSRSSFSYVAALLSRGYIYYFPFWHPPSPTWARVEDLGLTAEYW